MTSRPRSALERAADFADAVGLARGYAVPDAPGHVNVLACALLDLVEQLEAEREARFEVEVAAALFAEEHEKLKEQFEAMRDFLVALVDDEWGKQTPPYTGSFEPMNQWISNPASIPHDQAYRIGVAAEDEDYEIGLLP